MSEIEKYCNVCTDWGNLLLNHNIIKAYAIGRIFSEMGEWAQISSSVTHKGGELLAPHSEYLRTGRSMAFMFHHMVAAPTFLQS